MEVDGSDNGFRSFPFMGPMAVGEPAVHLPGVYVPNDLWQKSMQNQTPTMGPVTARFANWGPPCRVLIENVSEWFSHFLPSLQARCLLGLDVWQAMTVEAMDRFVKTHQPLYLVPFFIGFG